MFQFLLPKPIKKSDYEDVLHAIKTPNHILINTLPIGEQSVLIKNTIPYSEEEAIVNQILTTYEMDSKTIIIYGKNANDASAEKKYRQISALGFQNVFLYGGGLFEWLLLQDIYGDVNFPTQGKTDNFLKYKPPSMISRVVYRSLTN